MIFRKPTRSVDRIFIHCSASDNPEHDHIDVIRNWHLERNFNDVGYHYFIQKSGNIQKGRSLEAAPAAQSGNNKGTIAICLHGLNSFDYEQFTSLKDLCDAIHEKIPDATFHGHREVSNKTCPNFDYQAMLGLQPNGKYPKRPKPLKNSRTIAGSATAGIATIAGPVIEETKEHLGPISHMEFVQPVLIALVLAGIGLAIYARVDDHKKAAR